MSDLELRRNDVAEYREDPTGGRLVAWAQAAEAAHQLANALTTTTFVPKHFKGNVGDATAAILMGDELGLSPLAAFRSIYVVHGTPALYARGMVALAQSRGHEVWTEKSTDSEVVVKGRRKGSEAIETAAWTIQRAAKAGYTSNNKYNSNPQEMLYSKAAAEICRKIAADALAGVPYSVEDLELEDDQPTTKVSRSGSTKVSRKAPESVETQPTEDFTPDAITKAQLTALNAAVSSLGLSREQKLAGVASVIGREVESTKDLSKDEATKVIKSLKAREDAAAMDAAAEVVQGELVEDPA